MNKLTLEKDDEYAYRLTLNTFTGNETYDYNYTTTINSNEISVADTVSNGIVTISPHAVRISDTSGYTFVNFEDMRIHFQGAESGYIYYDEIVKKRQLPTKTSQLTNDSGFLTGHQDISGKVDKVAGKGLSTNDYTNAAKAKVDAIPASPKYTDTVYNDTAVKNRLTAIENKENVTLTPNTARISNVSCTAKYFPLLGMVFVRIYGKICADLNVGYDYDLFTVGSRVPDSNAALSVKCGKNAIALAKTSSSGSAIQIRPLESGINGYDVFITGFWFA